MRKNEKSREVYNILFKAEIYVTNTVFQWELNFELRNNMPRLHICGCYIRHLEKRHMGWRSLASVRVRPHAAKGDHTRV
jgi:hypothetical protein